MEFPKQMIALVEAFASLPGVGQKTAQRYAFYALNQPALAEALAEALINARVEVTHCSQCFNISTADRCEICSATNRDHTFLVVVKTPEALMAFERSGEFHGLYHVLGGLLSPLDGITPEALHLPELTRRVRDLGIKEVMVATSADMEGEATADYIQRLLSPQGITVSRPAYGLPVGGEIEYADPLTLSRSMAGRKSAAAS
jgi:recombination protein RecR